MTYTELTDASSGLNPPIILGNTYHLALDPGTPVLETAAGLHNFSTWPNAMLTDSGGFQMVSLLKLADINEEGVRFESPYEKDDKRMIMLRPEDSIRTQNTIGADVIMQLDDVVSSVAADEERFEVATHRTLRWLDRCLAAHGKKSEQSLFAIAQGGLDTSPGGLRDVCLEGFRRRDSLIPGYAIGGLAGGESKDAFWRVVAHACRAMPVNKPRYLMGVGYPLDLVVCTALGVDMYDCVYPTRTARFGVALVDGVAPGTLRLKSAEYAGDLRVVDGDCGCQCCKGGFSRSKLHNMLKSGEPVAVQLMTSHNIAYMLRLSKRMREAVLEDRYGEFATEFVGRFYPGGYDPEYSGEKGGEEKEEGEEEEKRGGEEEEKRGGEEGEKREGATKREKNGSVEKANKKQKRESKKLAAERKRTGSRTSEKEEEVKDPCMPRWVVESLSSAGIDVTTKKPVTVRQVGSREGGKREEPGGGEGKVNSLQGEMFGN